MQVLSGISRINPWDLIFKKGIPDDLREPYPNFSLILKKVIQPTTKTVLDIAMGTGRHSVVLAQKGLDVWGFDLSESALSLAEKELLKKNLHCHIQKADMFLTLPYQDAFFHAVVAVQAIYHGYREDMEKAILEVYRVLKPKGYFGFTVSLDRGRSALGSLSPEFQEVAPYTYIPLSGREKGMPHFYPSTEEIYQLLREKFTHIDIWSDQIMNYKIVTAQKR